MTRNQKIKYGVALALVSPMSVFAAAGDPTPIDFSPLTSGVDFTTVVAAILAIALLISNVNVAASGAKRILGFLKTL